ncbi:MAG: PAS domain S-box protein [Verrucomicrobiae bacterium]|nr:PAS domain S-box protein [Verrucomicrobiae bacterium]
MTNHRQPASLEAPKTGTVWRSPAFFYTFAVAVTGLTLLARLGCSGWIGGNRPLLVIFFIPIICSAYLGGLGPGLVATAIATIGAQYYLIPPTHSFLFANVMDFVQWLFLVASGVLASILNEALHRARRHANVSQQLNQVTLASIGDGVISTDDKGRVTFLNVEAERLTGWTNAEAAGQPLHLVFRIINDQTREVVEDPVKRVFRTGAAVSLANHTALIARNGREIIIDDSAAPIRQPDGTLIGVVLVFRDNTEKKKAEAQVRESQALYHSLVDQMPAGIFRKDAAGRYVFVNSYFCRLRNATPEQFLGKLPAELPASEDRFKIEAAEHHVQIMQTGRSIEVLDEYHRPDGRVLYFQVVKSPVFDADGKISGSEGVLFDVTERKQADQSRAQLAALVEFSSDAIIGKTLDGIITSWNHGAEHIFGYTAAEAIGQKLPGLLPPRREHEEELIFARVAQGETFERVEMARIRKDGRPVDLSATISPVKDASGKIIGVSKIVRDITEKKRLEERTAREQARFKLVFDTVPVGIALHTIHPDGHVTRLINDAHLRICGLTREQHDEPGIYDRITHPDDRAPQARLKQEVDAGLSKQFSLEKRYVRLDGKVVWVNFSYQREKYLDGTVEELTTVMDITERRQTEAELRWKTTLFEAQADSTLDGILVVDGNGKKIIQNRRMEELWKIPGSIAEDKDDTAQLQYCTGRTKNPQQFAAKVFELNSHPDEVSRDEIELVDGTVLDRYSAPVKNKAGKYYGRIWVFRDISEHRKLEAQLRQSQKMEAIGQLSGGIAHDFNNLLTAILGNATLLSEPELEPGEVHEAIQEIVRATHRAADLTRQLLLFSRKQAMRATAVDLNLIVTQSIKLLQRILGEDVTLHSEYAPSLPACLADSSMIQQVILNLAVNARDAMPRGGQLKIRTSAEVVKNPEAPEEIKADTHLCLTVADTGTGIPAEVLPHIFAPFFTTKEVGKGTGLGLATVYGIIRQHSGWITVSSEPGQGTIFQIYLPAIASAASRQPVPPAAARPPRGTGTILVIEDEPPVRTFVCQFLKRLGYEVIPAANGAEALELWRQQHGKISLVLTDIIMPGGMTGHQLAAQLTAEEPGLKIIFTSGYTGTPTAMGEPLNEGENFIRKPFDPEALAEIIRRKLIGAAGEDDR